MNIKSLFLSASLLAALVSPTLTYAKVNVFACVPEWASLATELGGDKVKVYQATSAKQDAHRIEARPSLIAKMRKADISVCAGAELEVGWLPLVIRQSTNKKVQPGNPGYFEAAMVVDRLEETTNLDRSGGDVHAHGNPHVHLSPTRVLTVAEKLSERLSTIDPENTAHYDALLRDFKTRWNEALTRWSTEIEPLKGKKVITYHKNWSYLIDWIGLVHVGDLEPKPGLPPTTSHLSSLIKLAKKEEPFAILTATYQNPKSGQWLETKTGVKALQLPYTVGGSDKATDLISLYDETIGLILGALPQ